MNDDEIFNYSHVWEMAIHNSEHSEQKLHDSITEVR